LLYNFESDKLNLTTKDEICFDLELRSKITVVKGKSATGKTLLWNELDLIKKDEIVIPQEERVAVNIELINRYTTEEEIKKLMSSSGKLIIIDNADILFKANERLADSIVDSEDNRFLIFSRDTADLGVSPNHYGEFYKENKTVTVKYAFSVKGWL
jgi:hypothetical protein